jgi:hypothetical protein
VKLDQKLLVELEELEEPLPLMLKLDVSLAIRLGPPFWQHLWHLQ